jgi:hypothetical protein
MQTRAGHVGCGGTRLICRFLRLFARLAPTPGVEHDGIRLF